MSPPFLITAGPNLQLVGSVYDLLLGQSAVFIFTALNVSGRAQISAIAETFPVEWSYADNGNNTFTLQTTATEVVGSFSITLRAIDASRQPVFATYALNVINVPVPVPPFDPCGDYTPPADPEDILAEIGTNPDQDEIENVTEPSGGVFDVCEEIV